MPPSTTNSSSPNPTSPFALATAYKRLTTLSHSEFYHTFTPLLAQLNKNDTETQHIVPLNLTEQNDITLAETSNSDTYLCLDQANMATTHPEFRETIEQAFLETLVAADSARSTLPQNEHERYRQLLRQSRQ